MNRDALKEILLEYQATDDVEAERRTRMLALLESEGDPFSRDHMVPGHFTASTFVLSPDGRSILLILHQKLGLWLQPGGHVDPGDTDIFAAAARELREETSLWAGSADTVPALLDIDIHTIPENPSKGEPAHEHFDIRVLFHSKHLDVEVGTDALDARWVELDDIGNEATDESVMRAVRKIRFRSDLC